MPTTGKLPSPATCSAVIGRPRDREVGVAAVGEGTRRPSRAASATTPTAVRTSMGSIATGASAKTFHSLTPTRRRVVPDARSALEHDAQARRGDGAERRSSFGSSRSTPYRSGRHVGPGRAVPVLRLPGLRHVHARPSRSGSLWSRPEAQLDARRRARARPSRTAAIGWPGGCPTRCPRVRSAHRRCGGSVPSLTASTLFHPP